MRKEIEKIKAFLEIEKLNSQYNLIDIKKDIIQIIKETYEGIKEPISYKNFLTEIYHNYGMFHGVEIVEAYMKVMGVEI